MDVVVIGGGVIGLSVAWHLLPNKITIVDVAKPGAASRASAGMLAPFAEAKAPGPLLDLGVASLREYPRFLEAIDGVRLSGPGMLRIGAPETVVKWTIENGFGEIVKAREVEPNVAAEEALFTPDEKHIDPPALVRALEQALRARGVRFTGERVAGDVTVIATGAWTERYSFPVRGQLIALRSSAVRATVYAPGTYLVPRDGRIIVGATEEHVGFDMTVTAGDDLRQRAAMLVPELRDAEIVDAWCGFRPGTIDGLPVIGRIDERTYVATAHYRNGILLAPITGKLLAELINTGVAPPLLHECAPDRFWSAAAEPLQP